MLRRGTLLAVVLAACSSSSTPSLGDAVTAWQQENDVSRISVTVLAPDGTEHWSTGDGLYEVGSLTKTLIATTALVLAEEGLVNLDAPVGLDGFPRSDEITLRQLLSHTAGLRDGGDQEAELSDLTAFLAENTTEELLAEAADGVGQAQLPAPHEYANSGYWVAGAAIEEATGEDLAVTVRRRVLAPLGLEDTYLAWAEDIDEPLVPGELVGPGEEPFVLPTEVLPGLISTAWAAGGVVSTSDDMAMFFREVLEGELDGTGQITQGTATYGVGVSRFRWPGGVAGWGHNGAIPGYTATAVRADSGWTVAILTNRFQVSADGLSPDTEELAGELLALLEVQD